MQPGAVLQIRVQTWQEHVNPLPQTDDSGQLLEFVTHSTWESIPASVTLAQVPPEGPAVEDPTKTDGGDTLEPQRPPLVMDATSWLQHVTQLRKIPELQGTTLLDAILDDDIGLPNAIALWQYRVQRNLMMTKMLRLSR